MIELGLDKVFQASGMLPTLSRSGKVSITLTRSVELQNFIKPCAGGGGNAGVADHVVQLYGLFHAVEICYAVRAIFEVFLDLTTLSGTQLVIEVLADVLCDVHTVVYLDQLGFHAFMYPCNCSRRNARARWSLDLTAGTDSFRIFAVSSADCASISLSKNTAR